MIRHGRPGSWRERLRSPLSVSLACIGFLAAAKATLLLLGSSAGGGTEPPTALPPGAGVAAAFWPEEAEPAAGPDVGEGRPARAASRGQEEWAGQPLAELPELDPQSLAPSEIELLQQLAARRAALEEREQEIALREALIDAAEARLSRQLEELTRLKASLEGMVEQRDAAQTENLRSLVKIYETMKPKAAAEIFDRLEMNVLLEVVAHMREVRSAAVIARMDPLKAKALTAELARRRQASGGAARQREGGH